jgi:hypothetical protein
MWDEVTDDLAILLGHVSRDVLLVLFALCLLCGMQALT